MSESLNICFEISDLDLSREISDQLKSLASINLIHNITAEGDFGLNAFKAAPEIILLEDRCDASDILPRLAALRRNFPLAALFVISKDSRPEHIVEVMKAGAAEFFVTPVDAVALQKAIEKTRDQRRRAEGRHLGTGYCFISSKGGLGATTLAVNTAALMAQHNHDSVVLCDLCFQASDDSALLDIIHDKTIIELCRNFHRLDPHFLKGVLARHATGLDFLSAPHKPEEGEEIRPEHIEKICSLLRETHRRLIIDCPSMTVNDCTVHAFMASEKIFVVIDLSVPAVRNAARLTELFRKLGVPAKKVEFVVNRYIKSSPLSLESAEKTLGKKVFWLFPNDFEDVFSSINRGVPLATFNPRAILSKNLTEFAQKLRTSNAADDYRGMRGTFGKAL